MKHLNIYLFCLLLLFTTCSKEKSSQDCNISGFGISQTFRFWTSIPMYNTEVEVKDDAGNLVDTKVTVGYYAAEGVEGFEPDACEYDASKEAVFELRKGKAFTYTATNGSRIWRGTINVPCEGGSRCNNLRIQ